MKILVVADEESRRIWDFYQPGMLAEYDLILSCGDLSSDYLQFLVTMSKAPVVYVHGNHDANYEQKPPLGCLSADGKLVKVKGLRILGLGGAMKYREGPHLYTDREQTRRAKKLRALLWWHKGFDILLTHAPAKDLHDGDDIAHKGFSVFTRLIDKYHPKYFLHGHLHKNYGGKYCQLDQRGETTIVNTYGTYVIDL